MALPYMIAHYCSCDRAIHRQMRCDRRDEKSPPEMERLLSELSLVRPIFAVEVKRHGRGRLWGQNGMPSFTTDQMR